MGNIFVVTKVLIITRVSSGLKKSHNIMLIYSKYKYLHVKIVSTIIERASSQSGHHDMQVI